MTGSRKKAMDSFCRKCLVDDQPGNGSALYQITKCTTYDCDLFPFRPTQPGWSDETRSFNLAQPDSDKSTPANQIEAIVSGQDVLYE